MGKVGHGKKLFQTLGLIFLGLAGLATASSPAAASPARVAVRETVYDFGKVVEDQKLSHTFTISNQGGEPLRIENVDPDCACTAADYSRVIAPGKQGILTLTIKPYSVVHGFNKKTRVRFNDPECPLVVFTLKGVAQPFIEIKPSHIVRLRGAPGDNLQGQVRFISHLPSPWKITRWRTNIPDKIEVSVKAEVPDKVYVVTVKNKRQEPGAYGGLIELFTTSQKRPRLIVRVFGQLYLPSAGSP
jgi:hypothetical protein